MLPTSQASIFWMKFNNTINTSKGTQKQKISKPLTSTKESGIHKGLNQTFRINNKWIDLSETLTPLVSSSKLKNKQLGLSVNKAPNILSLTTKQGLQHVKKLIQTKQSKHIKKRKEIQLKKDYMEKKLNIISGNSSHLSQDTGRAHQNPIFDDENIFFKNTKIRETIIEEKKGEHLRKNKFSVRYQHKRQEVKSQQKRSVSLQVKASVDCTPWINNKEYFEESLQPNFWTIK